MGNNMNAGNARRQQAQNVENAGMQQARNAEYAGRQQAQNLGIAARQQAQNLGNAGRQQAQNAGNAERQLGQNAENAERQLGQNARNAERQQGQNARNAERQRIQNVGNALRQQGQNAGNAERQQGQNAGNAARQLGQNARNAGRQQVQNAENAERQQGQNAGFGRRQQGRNAGRQQVQIVGYAGRQQGQNAGNADRQLGQNAGNAERQLAQNARNAGRQVQNAGNAERQQGQNAGYGRRQQGRNDGWQRGQNADYRGQQDAGVGRQLRQNETHPQREFQRNNPVEPKQVLSFTTLESISKSDVSDIFAKLSDKQKFFSNLLQSPITKPDVFSLIMQITFKVTQSPYEQLKQKFILELCNPTFITNLQTYLMMLPFTANKSQNNMYWKDQNEFWKNFVCFCDCLVTLSPSTALKHCKCLIEAASRSCLEGLKNRHGYTSSDDYENQLQVIRNLLAVSENEELENHRLRKTGYTVEVTEPPPDCFRQLSVIPDRDDLILEFKPYLRPNHIKGAYQDVEHYLDVQFRLLREDCFGPLRKGIRHCLPPWQAAAPIMMWNMSGESWTLMLTLLMSQREGDYLDNPKKKKYENIRIFHGCQFTKPYVNKDKIGSIIQFGEKDSKRFQKMKWNNNKRFIFGSLLLLTKDNFNSFITVTILDRDPKLLAIGQIPVTIINNHLTNPELYNDDVYIMVESSVYFEPYLHVMRALQDPQLPTTLPMQKYIVHVDMQVQPPGYLKEDLSYNVGANEFVVLGDSWPTANQLGMNESQQRAFRLALTHECAVVQGPPGTGKTFIGVLIAKTLLRNLTKQGPLILLICYTNHALDQFLKAIMQITPNVARIGGQSKDKDLETVNLSALRKGHKSSLFWQNKHALTSVIRDLRNLQSDIDSINNDSVIGYESLKHLPEARVVANQCKNKNDPIEYWLFEDAAQFVNVEAIIDMEHNEDQEDAEQQIEEHFGREDIVLDDLDCGDYDKEISSSFIAYEANKKINSLRLLLNETFDPIQIDQIRAKIHRLFCKIKLLRDMKKNQPRLRMENITDKTQAFQLPMNQRWAIYLKWERVLMGKYNLRIKQLKDTLAETQGTYEEARMVADAEILKTRRVIGITTSGAARVRKLLMALATPIVIVEEAAEVLEQHIISSLTPHCQHLILIGDHQQLRPSASSLLLARHYDLEVSLFERMILNDVHSCRLSVQHRMRPQLAQLISPHIYPDLLNHESVEAFPNVRGLASNLFFLTHDYKETAVDDSSSRSNHQEADLVLSLANYIMQQDYNPEDVTILAAYAGQLFYMMKQRANYMFLSKVKITVVDNYQGEESKIILLSLVRNNDDNKIGFLGTANRICVALSRAREGFYIFGNIDILKRNSELWTGIAGTLEKNQCLGTSLILRCESHNNQLTEVSKVEHFNSCPEGGCLLKCNYNLPCNHQCGLVCHGYDRNHQNIACKADCDRILCQFNHKCPLKCVVKCRSCMVSMDRTFKKCGHVNKVPCYQLEDPLQKCRTTVTKELPCKHKVKAMCFEKPEEIKCPEKCDARLKCGHVCRSLCHIFKDPDHETAKCARSNRGCTAEAGAGAGVGAGAGAGAKAMEAHQCRKRCHEPCDPCTVEVMKKRSDCTHKQLVKCCEDVHAERCNKNCARSLPCGHHCKKKCWEPCGDCKQKMKKTISECGHEVTTTCDKPATRKDCTSKCTRTLSCGHPCPDVCSRPCDSTACTTLLTTKTFHSPCGHDVHLPCNIYRQVRDEAGGLRRAVLRACAAACGAELACGHACAAACGACAQGRLHRACAAACGNYNICGHLCKEPCKEICPPCAQPCEVRCPHSRCPNRCGEPCAPCNEECSRRCAHAACSRRCGEPCSVGPCARACPRRLPCGDACRGLCGEPCPPVCRRCRPDDFPVDFLGDAFEDDDKFILLQDCGHVMELDNMNNLMQGDHVDIKIRDCPYCRKPIINTHRYKDIVNDMFKRKINPIKRKIYGTDEAIRETTLELKTKFGAFDTKYRKLCLESPAAIKSVFIKLSKTVNASKGMHLQQLKVIIVCLNILEMIMECYKTYNELKEKNETLDIAFYDLIDMICGLVKDNSNKLSTQMQNDIRNEIKRLNAIAQLTKIFNLPAYTSNSKVVAAQAKDATDCVLDWKKFDESTTFKAFDVLQHKIKVSGIVTKQERDLVVQAIGLKPGHWFQCPNGHFYCIGECGGAMEISTCPECGSAIGGTSHTLLSNNSHAKEIDGSNYPAWSNMAMNMANYQF